MLGGVRYTGRRLGKKRKKRGNCDPEGSTHNL